MANKFIIAGHADINTYAYLYNGARHQKKIAEKEDEGQLYTIMCSYFSLAFCLEAYLNHVGKLRIKDWDKIERNLSQKKRLKRICSLASLNIDYKISPFITVKNLVSFRNCMAHGKSERIKDSFVVSGEKDQMNHKIEPDWINFCKIKNLENAFQDIEELIKTIHKQVGLTGNPFNNLSGGMLVKQSY